MSDTPNPDLVDIVVYSQNLSQRVAPNGIHALMRHMLGLSYLQTIQEVRQQDWVAYYATPGPNAHSLFMEGEAPDVPWVFKECIIEFGSKKTTLNLDPVVEVYVAIRFVGVPFDRLQTEFTDTLKQILYIKPVQGVSPHQPETDRLEADGTEAPKRRPARDTNLGRTGVAVEDL